MDIKNFKAGVLRSQFKNKIFQYKSFSPVKINESWWWSDPKINVLLERATNKLGELNAFSFIVPNIDLFIRMHIMKEANASSRIEGTKTNMEEDLLSKDIIPPEKRDDWQDVQNYVKAMNIAIDELDNLPLSNKLIRKTHSVLMESVRGENSYPGEFRKSPNWIGGSNLSDAVFIPPHHEEVQDLMSDLERFLHNQDIDVPHLIRIAIIHYQFETIHPFCDGNGRIGRLLITLYLVSKNLLQKPSLYLSDFLMKNRSSYYDALSRVRESNDLVHWIKFFLNAVIEISEKGIETFKNILILEKDVDNRLATLNRKAKNSRRLIQFLYNKPIVNVGMVKLELGFSPMTAHNLIKDFVRLDILSELTGYKRNRVFIFNEYFNLFFD